MKRAALALVFALAACGEPEPEPKATEKPRATCTARYELRGVDYAGPVTADLMVEFAKDTAGHLDAAWVTEVPWSKTVTLYTDQPSKFRVECHQNGTGCNLDVVVFINDEAMQRRHTRYVRTNFQTGTGDLSACDLPKRYALIEDNADKVERRDTPPE